MFILTREDDTIFEISETKNYEENGNILIHNDELSIPTRFVKAIYEVEVPEKIQAEKWCYTPEKGFYKNKDYVEYFSVEQRIAALEDAVNTLLGF